MKTEFDVQIFLMSGFCSHELNISPESDACLICSEYAGYLRSLDMYLIQVRDAIYTSEVRQDQIASPTNSNEQDRSLVCSPSQQ